MENEKWVENTAVLRDNGVDRHAGCGMCEEKYLFRMKDTRGEFALGLRTVLECLAVADKEGIIPHVPDDWWLKINRLY